MFSQILPVDQLIAKIEARVGEFLTLKNRLFRLKAGPDPEISMKATGLLFVQQKLEEQLADILSTIQKARAEGLSFNTVPALINAGSFYAQMEKQIKDVKNLESQTKNESVFEWKRYIFVGGIAVLVILIASGALRYGKS